MNKKEILVKVNDENVSFDDLYQDLSELDLGNWDDVNSETTVLNYCRDMMFKGVSISHILKAIEDKKSEHDLYAINLGNSMRVADPINNKLDLIKALGLITERMYTVKFNQTTDIQITVSAINKDDAKEIAMGLDRNDKRIFSDAGYWEHYETLLGDKNGNI